MIRESGVISVEANLANQLSYSAFVGLTIIGHNVQFTALEIQDAFEVRTGCHFAVG